MNRARETEFSPDAICRIHFRIECDCQCDTRAVAERQTRMLCGAAQGSGGLCLLFGEGQNLFDREAYLGQRGDTIPATFREYGVGFGQRHCAYDCVEDDGAYNIRTGFFVK